MKKYKVLINKTQNIEHWKPTLNLRWLEQGLGKNVDISYRKVKVKRLQQMFQSSLGNIEWREIHTETES